MKTFQMITAALATFAMTSNVFAAGKAKVEVSAKKLDGDKAEFTFKTLPSDGLKINSEGPWKLEIKDGGSVKFDKTEMKRGEWKESDAAFIQSGKIKPKTQSSQVAYKLTAFVCTQDKGQCFREVIEGKTDVKW
jgi:hypothetical protein